MRPRMYGSTERKVLRTTTSPSPGARTSISTRAKSAAVGVPSGRAARWISRLRNPVMDARHVDTGPPLDCADATDPRGGDLMSDAAAGGGELAGRVAVVTGAARGLGLAIARGMAAAGASVAMGARSAAAGERAAAEVRALGVRTQCFEC